MKKKKITNGNNFDCQTKTPKYDSSLIRLDSSRIVLEYLKNMDIETFMKTLEKAVLDKCHQINQKNFDAKLTPCDLFDIYKIIHEPHKFIVVNKEE